MEKLTLLELTAQSIEMLPARDTLWLNININVAPVVGANTALALNAATIGSNASAYAQQWIGVWQ